MIERKSPQRAALDGTGRASCRPINNDNLNADPLDLVESKATVATMESPYFNLIHVIISLVGIASGFGMLSGLLAGRIFPRWTALFLTTTAATSVTGFFFPFRGFTPAIAVGIISLLLLGLAIYALCLQHLAGRWRKAYVISAVSALYLNTFVLIAQLFQKMPVLKALAPTQTEPAFAATQAAVLIVFILLGITAAVRFRAAPLSPT
jgi:hypothetical protein